MNNSQTRATPPYSRRWRPSKRWTIAGVGVVAVLTVLLVAGPSMLVHTPLRDFMVAMAIGDYPANYQIGSAQISWWDPVRLRDVSLKDMHDRTMLQVDQVTTERPLFLLATSRDEVGRVRLVNPAISMRYDDDGINLARVWDAYLESNRETASETVNFALGVVNGSISQTGGMPLGLDMHRLNGCFVVENRTIRGEFMADMLGGTIRAKPQITYRAEDIILAHSGKATIEVLQLKAEQVNNWLSLAAPLLSGVSRFEGKLSGSIQSTEFSLLYPEKGSAAGEVSIEAGQIATGPLAQAVLDVGRRLYAILEQPVAGKLPEGDQWEVRLPDQSVQFHIQDGLVVHDSLEAEVGGLLLETSGSVGFDESLDIQLATTIPRSWTNESEWLQELGGERLYFQIQGTLTNPTLDDAALVDLVEQLGTKLVLESVADSMEQSVLELFGF